MGIGLFFKASLSIIPRVNFGIRHFLRHLLFSMSILGIPMCLEASPISKVNIVRPHMLKFKEGKKEETNKLPS